MDWYWNIEDKVYSIIKDRLESKYTADYPNFNVTNTDEVVDNPMFPTVFVETLEGLEKGQDLENKTVNAVLAAFQIKITTNTKRSDLREIVNDVISIMKELGFNTIGMPVPVDDKLLYSYTTRFRRMIGSADNF